MEKINKLFNSDLNVINLGLAGFAEELDEQGVDAIHVDWKPPAGGNEKVQNLLDQLKN